MALFRANAAGDIIQFFNTYQLERDNPNPPASTAYSLQFDEATNAGILAAYNANSAQFRMDGGTLTQNGTPVEVNPPDLFYSAFQDRAALLAKARANNTPPTSAEVWQLLGVAFRLAGF